MHADAAVTGLSRTPAAALRNTVQPLADVVNVTLKSKSGQTANHIEGRSFANVLQWSISAVGAAAFASLVLTGTLNGTTATFSGRVSATHNGVGLPAFFSSGAAATTRDMFGLQTAGVNRWLIRLSSDAESGSDAGSAFQILARTDAGGGLDTPLSIIRASGGLVTINRPLAVGNGTYALSVTAALDVTGTSTFTTLAGSGTRLVTASATGVLGTSTATAFGLVSGTGAANRVAYWSGSDTLTSTGNLTFNGSALVLTGTQTISSTLGVSGTLTGAAGTFSGTITGNSSGSGTSSAFLASAASPTYTVVVTGAGTNEKNWDMQGAATTLSFRTRTDANSTGVDWLVATRSGTTVTSVALPILVGTGTRLVTASAAGALGTSTATAFGLVSGTGVIFKIAFWANADTITYSTDFYTNLSTIFMPSLSVTGSASAGSLGVTGQAMFTSLVGSGTRFVTADLNGILGTTTISGSGGVLGTSVANRVAYWSATDTITGSANLTFSGTALVLTGTQTISSTLGVSGTATLSGLLVLSGGAATGTTSQAELFSNATHGLVIIGRLGATNDILIANHSGQTIMNNPAGGITVTFPGAISMSSTLNVTALVTASAGIQLGAGTGAPGRIYTTATAGTIIYGAAGSSFDFILANSAGANVFTVPTGTTTAAFAGAVTIGTTLGVTGNTTLTGTLTGNSTGINTLAGPLHIGTTSTAARAFRIAGVTLSGDNQIGALISPTFTSASTTTGTTIIATLATAASAFTMTNGYAIQISSPSIGAGSAITTAYGLKVENQTAGGTNYAIFTGTGLVRFGDLLTVNGGTGAGAGLSLYHVTTDATNKEGRVKSGHYTNAEEPVTMMWASNLTSTNNLYIGGNSSAENAVTSIDFLTAANNTTVSGTRRGGFSSAGVFDVVGNTTVGGTLVVTGLLTANGDIRATSASSPSAVGLWLTGEALYLNRAGGAGAIVFQNGSAANGWTIQRNTPSTGNLTIHANALTGESSELHIRNTTGGTATAIFDTENGRLGVGSNSNPNATLDIAGNALISGTLGLTGALTHTVLAGTGTRLVTATSTGVLGNATTIAGQYEFTGIVAFDVAINFAGNGVSATASIFRTAADGINIRGVNGSSNAFALMAANGTIILRNPQATTDLQVAAAVTLETTLTIATSSVNGSLLAYTNSTGSANYTTGVGGSSGGAFPNGAYTIRDTTVGAIRFTIASTGAVTIAGATNLSSTLAVTSAITATGGIIFNGGGSTLNHYETGSFNGTLTGCTTSPALSINYVRIGNMVMLHFTATLTATSNTNACTITGVPASIRPATAQCMDGLYEVIDGGTVLQPTGADMFEIGTGGAITGYRVSSATGWSPAGTKGIRKSAALGSGGFTLYYSMT